MISEQPLNHFLDDLASAAPTPGGGSAAAIMGAMGGALVSMVCNLTIGKKGYEQVEAPMKLALEQAEALRSRLTAMVAEDVEAFETLMAAYRLPRASEDDRRLRSEAIQAGLKRATDVPLSCALACGELIELTQRVAMMGNKAVISDAGVAVLAAHAALRSAALNVDINVPSIKDAEFVGSRRARLIELLQRSAAITEDTMHTVHGRLA